jgi:hypothetical protein
MMKGIMKQKYFFAAFIFFSALSFAHPAGKEALILNMEGAVYVKQKADGAWEAAQKNMLLPSGAIISTGVKSFVELKIEEPGRAEESRLITINSLSRYMVGETLVEGDESVQRGGLSPRLPIGFGISARIKLLAGSGNSDDDGSDGGDSTRTSMDGPFAAYDFRKSRIPTRRGINVELTWPQP